MTAASTKRSRTKTAPGAPSPIKPSVVRRILAPVDFSAASLRAASFAFALARQLGAEVRCTTVIDVLDLHIAVRAGLPEFETNADLKRQVRDWIHKEFAALTATTDVNVQLEVRRGIPEDEILKAARRYKPDLIVMGSNGIARRLPLGSRTRAVMRGTLVPVLIVRPTGNEQENAGRPPGRSGR